MNGRWRDTLTTEDISAYVNRALTELGADCAYDSDAIREFVRQRVA